MMLLGGNKRTPSEYSDNGRRMIGFDRGYEPMDNRYYPRPERMEYGGGKEGNTYGDIYAHGSIYAPGAMNKPAEYRLSDRDTHEPITEHKARKWVDHMTTGEHYKPEATEQHRAVLCPDCEKWEYFVAMNAMYADFNKTAKEMGIDKPEYYARLARDFIHDDDAGPGKVAKYMEMIPKK